MSYSTTTPMFINNSGLPINIETWQQDSLNIVLVKPGEQIILPSITGEWYLQTYLTKEFAEEWKKCGMQPGTRIGKFRNKPCVLGNYSWIADEAFQLIYNIDDTTNIATATLKKIN